MPNKNSMICETNYVLKKHCSREEEKYFINNIF